jgi:hypothetical protein
MLGTKTDYTGCAILLQTENGEHLKRCVVSYFDKETFHLKLRSGIPSAFSIGDVCSLLIMTEPAPREYKGRVVIDKSERVLLLFRGKERENRKATRYKVDFQARVNALVRHNEVYKLHTPTPVMVLNISRTGMRLAAPANALRKNDRVILQVKLEDGEKLLTAVVINWLDMNEYLSEYGCALIANQPGAGP